MKHPMTTFIKPAFELADVVRLHGERFISQHNPLGQHRRVLNAISKCRTAALGGHIDKCGACQHERISYNSCRNRHCPKCQGTNRERWIMDRQQDLLPVPYFHVVFTLPEQLNCNCLKDPEGLYNILFAAVNQTITTLAANPKHLGAQTGMIAVLHTWGQQLWLHPHIHCIVPAGGVTKYGHWKYTKTKGRFLFPVKVMSALFRGVFMALFKAYCSREGITPPLQVFNQLYKMSWVVYAKQPFLGLKQVIEYLGRYTHRIAISNHRIKSIDNDTVTFTYKDYRDAAKQKHMTLRAEEFLRRFCMHVLPPGFRKIRHYGLLSSRAKPQLKTQQMKMGVSIVKKEKLQWQQVLLKTMRYDVDACPACKKGRMQTVLFFRANAPPALIAPSSICRQ